MIFKIVNNKLILHHSDGTKQAINFRWPIADILEHDQALIVRVEPPIGSCDNRNVFGLGAEGQLLWQIDQVQQSYADSPYTGMMLTSEGLSLFNWDGSNVLVHPESGSIIRQSQGK